MKALALAALLMLSGCAEGQAAVKAFVSEAESDRVNIANDRLTGEIMGICRTTYYDLVTNAAANPSLAIAVPALCGHIVQAPAVGVLGETIPAAK